MRYEINIPSIVLLEAGQVKKEREYAHYGTYDQ